jgi:phosphoribosylanthranilate isomerase
MTRIKICGITEVDQALAAASAGADYIGLVFAPSRRTINAEQAVAITSALRQLPHPPACVGVFVNLAPGEVKSLATRCCLDYVQLSGDESWDYCREIDRPIIKALHVAPGCTSRSILDEIEKGHAALSAARLTCLLDTGVQGSYGGTGQSLEMSLAEEIAARYPVIVAGGLTAAGAGRLLTRVRPWGVDVSSGVETHGKKDISKIVEFIRTVREYDRGLGL